MKGEREKKKKSTIVAFAAVVIADTNFKFTHKEHTRVLVYAIIGEACTHTHTAPGNHHHNDDHRPPTTNTTESELQCSESAR